MRKLFTILFCLSVIWCTAQEWVRQHPFPDVRDVNDLFITESGFGVAVGDDGLLMTTDDFGENWDYPSGDFGNGFNRVEIVENESGLYTIWCLGYDDFKSEDSGASWVEANQNAGVGGIQYTAYPKEGHLFIGNNQKLAKTTDGGESWTEITPDSIAFLTNIFFLDENYGWVGDRLGNIHLTQDGGESWTAIAINPGNHFVQPVFKDQLNGYASVKRDVYQTSDGGFSWELLSSNAFGNYTDFFEIVDGQTMVATPNDRSVSRTTDGGQSWQNTFPSESREFVRGLHALPDGRVWVAGDVRSILASSDAGLTYEDQIPGTRKDAFFIEFADFDHGWAVCTDEVLKTTDGGNHWQLVSPLVEPGQYEHINDGLAISADELWLAGEESIIKTTDGGVSWQEVFNPGTDQFTSLATTEAAMFATNNDGKIYRSTDNGVNWAAAEVPNTERLSDCHFANAQVGYAVGRSSTVMKTIDGGSSWDTLATGMPDNQHFRGVHFLNENKGWAVTSQLSDNIWWTEDGGLSWSSTSTPSNIYLSGLFFVNDTLGYVYGGSSAYGRIFQTTDGGVSWSEYYYGPLRINDIHQETSTNGSHRFWIAGEGGNIELLENLVPTKVDEAQVHSLKVFPNPVSGTLQLELPEGMGSDAVLYLYNLSGQLMWAMPASPQIPLHNLRPGTYLLALADGSKVFRSRLVKAR